MLKKYLYELNTVNISWKVNLVCQFHTCMLIIWKSLSILYRELNIEYYNVLFSYLLDPV